jgi:hypothetical protein
MPIPAGTKFHGVAPGRKRLMEKHLIELIKCIMGLQFGQMVLTGL